VCSNGRLGARVQLHDVIVQRHDRHGVLVAVEAVDRVRDVQLHVTAALGRRHETQLLAGVHDPLPLLVVAYHVRLDVRRAVMVLVALQVRFDFFIVAEVVA
jgi:hypothetical protein